MTCLLHGSFRSLNCFVNGMNFTSQKCLPVHFQGRSEADSDHWEPLATNSNYLLADTHLRDPNSQFVGRPSSFGSFTGYLARTHVFS